MDAQNQRALLAIALLASNADGSRDEREKEAIQAALERIRAQGLDAQALWSEIEDGRRDLARTARELTSPEARALAYELAVCACGADGATNGEERAFLDALAGALGLPRAASERFRREADALADTALTSGASAGELDGLILQRAILCGGLELLPQSLATLAVLPLQMQLVYTIGKRHGHELDRGHVKEFLGVAGVGLASQLVEGFARRLVGGLLGRAAGGLLGGLGSVATGAGLSFATTYALGHAAQRYYAGGRRLTRAELGRLFSELLGQARELEPRHAAEIAAGARGLDLGALRRLASG
jgi:uncharacterized protein (DUF697 family)/tellurite resistance protein